MASVAMVRPGCRGHGRRLACPFVRFVRLRQRGRVEIARVFASTDARNSRGKITD